MTVTTVTVHVKIPDDLWDDLVINDDIKSGGVRIFLSLTGYQYKWNPLVLDSFTYSYGSFNTKPIFLKGSKSFSVDIPIETSYQLFMYRITGITLSNYDNIPILGNNSTMHIVADDDGNMVIGSLDSSQIGQYMKKCVKCDEGEFQFTDCGIYVSDKSLVQLNTTLKLYNRQYVKVYGLVLDSSSGTLDCSHAISYLQKLDKYGDISGSSCKELLKCKDSDSWDSLVNDSADAISKANTCMTDNVANVVPLTTCINGTDIIARANCGKCLTSGGNCGLPACPVLKTCGINCTGHTDCNNVANGCTSCIQGKCVKKPPDPPSPPGPPDPGPPGSSSSNTVVWVIVGSFIVFILLMIFMIYMSRK